MFSTFLCQILQKGETRGGCGMSIRPEFYSGRGATLSDLDSKKLNCIYDAIKKNIGDEAAHQFALMVASLPKLSATDFLLNLSELENNKWRWEIPLSYDGIYASDHASGIATVASVLFGDIEKDQTIEIRREFLNKVGLKEKKY